MGTLQLCMLVYLIGCTCSLFGGLHMLLDSDDPKDKKWGARMLLALPIWPVIWIPALAHKLVEIAFPKKDL